MVGFEVPFLAAAIGTCQLIVNTSRGYRAFVVFLGSLGEAGPLLPGSNLVHVPYSSKASASHRESEIATLPSPKCLHNQRIFRKRGLFGFHCSQSFSHLGLSSLFSGFVMKVNAAVKPLVPFPWAVVWLAELNFWSLNDWVLTSPGCTL